MAEKITNAMLKKDIEYLTKTVDRVARILEGNGKDGLVVQVDRLQQSEDSRKWHLRALYTMGLSGLAKWFF
jgi:hypothetical protein